MRTIDEASYRNSVFGGWLGKNAGGTLGGPVEGQTEVLDLDFYPDLPEDGGPLPNDDLDTQLVWLHALEEHGPGLSTRDLGVEWAEHVYYPMDEYGYAVTNLRRGIDPPVAGWFNNPFVDCMGSPIRSEIWAMVAPGAPGLAAEYARKDASIDHAGGEGVHGEVFNAAIESAAFVEDDPETLIDVGLAAIPDDSRVADALEDVRKWHDERLVWTETRERIVAEHGGDNWTEAPQNIGFTVLAWLYGDGFEDTVLKAVNCGYDTDCTAATMGALFGIIHGPEAIPERWIEPIGERIVGDERVRGYPRPDDLDELTDRTHAQARRVLAEADAPVAIGGTGESIPPDGIDPSAVSWPDVPDVGTVRYPVPGGAATGDLVLAVDWTPDGPAITPGTPTDLDLTVENTGTRPWRGTLTLSLPEGWQYGGETVVEIDPGEVKGWTPTVEADAVEWSDAVTVVFEREHAGMAWTRQAVDLGVVSTNRWTVSGPQDVTRTVEVPENCIRFEDWFADEGTYRAETTLSVPGTYEGTLIAESPSSITAQYDDEVVIDSEADGVSLPAFHRSPGDSRAELTFEAGEHDLEIDVETDGTAPHVWVVPLGTDSPEEPGPYPYLLDARFE